MAQTLRQILDDIAAFIDQDTTLATGAELTVRVNLVNQAVREWGDAYQWQALRVPYSPSFGASQVSLALPANFKHLMSPLVDRSLTVANTYVEIDPSERFDKLSSDRYCWLLGDEVSGKSLQVNPHLVSGASLVLDYQSYPSSMATLTDICIVPQPQFVTYRVVSRILEQRADSRFPIIKAEADQMLRTMVETEDVPSGGSDNRVPDWARQSGWRMGQD